tara:strand:- start:11147 stop:11617 length:471 start_codon:yes stop_codon:yes gene_type:complete
MDPKLIEEFPELEHPRCLRKGKHGHYTCGYCHTARALASGKMLFRLNGQEEPMERNEAIRYNLNICKRTNAMLELKNGSRTTIKQIRRDGQRILKAGTNVYVQLKRKKGTARWEGYVVECYEGDFVKVYLNRTGTTKVVPADEFVIGRRGTSEVKA